MFETDWNPINSNIINFTRLLDFNLFRLNTNFPGWFDSFLRIYVPFSWFSALKSMSKEKSKTYLKEKFSSKISCSVLYSFSADFTLKKCCLIFEENDGLFLKVVFSLEKLRLFNWPFSGNFYHLKNFLVLSSNLKRYFTCNTCLLSYGSLKTANIRAVDLQRQLKHSGLCPDTSSFYHNKNAIEQFFSDNHKKPRTFRFPCNVYDVVFA